MKDSQLRTIALKVKNVGEEVRRSLGGGFNESIYQNALAIEFRQNRIEYLKEVNIEIFYKGESVGVDRPDFIITKIGDCRSPILLELKAVDRITDNHRMQLKSYCTSLPRNDNPVLKDFLGGILMAFPASDINSEAKMKIFVVDKNFKVLIDEQAEEEMRVKIEKEKNKVASRKKKK